MIVSDAWVQWGQRFKRFSIVSQTKYVFKEKNKSFFLIPGPTTGIVESNKGGFNG
jgi:hypothetical protein